MFCILIIRCTFCWVFFLQVQFALVMTKGFKLPRVRLHEVNTTIWAINQNMFVLFCSLKLRPMLCPGPSGTVQYAGPRPLSITDDLTLVVNSGLLLKVIIMFSFLSVVQGRLGVISRTCASHHLQQVAALLHVNFPTNISGEM